MMCSSPRSSRCDRVCKASLIREIPSWNKYRMSAWNWPLAIVWLVTNPGSSIFWITANQRSQMLPRLDWHAAERIHRCR